MADPGGAVERMAVHEVRPTLHEAPDEHIKRHMSVPTACRSTRQSRRATIGPRHRPGSAGRGAQWAHRRCRPPERPPGGQRSYDRGTDQFKYSDSPARNRGQTIPDSRSTAPAVQGPGRLGSKGDRPGRRIIAARSAAPPCYSSFIGLNPVRRRGNIWWSRVAPGRRPQSAPWSFP